MTSQFPGGEMPGMAAMNDTLAFVKKLWGGMQVPGMITPTVSVDDLDKKIKDLKTVESWLNVNMNMLRGTIQALEVQRATIATLNSLGASFSSVMAAATTPEASPFSSTAAVSGAPPAGNPQWPMPPAAAKAASAAPPEDTAPEPEAAAEDDDEQAETGAADTAKADTAEAASSSQFVNPAAWWTLLQDQFKHAVNNAMAGELTGKQAQEKTAKAAPAAKKTVLKPAAKSSAKSGGAAKKTTAKPARKGSAAKSAKTQPVPAASDKRTTPKA